MKKYLAVLWCALPALAAVDGTVINQTTGKPQAGATVALYQLAEAGMEAVDQAKSDAQGTFVINRNPQGPHLIQTAYDGVTYNHMLPPGRPTTGLTLEVYDAASKQPSAVEITQHVIVFEPSGSELVVNESYVFSNAGRITWNDPDGGTLKFFLPAGAKGIVQVDATAPQGMPIRRAAEKAGREDVYKVDFPIKPGETRIDLSYLVPYTGGPYEGKLILKDEATRLVTPAGVTLTGDNLTMLGTEPRTQASIYELKGSLYRVEIEGTGQLRAQGGDGSDGVESSGPSIEQIMPRVNSGAKLIVGLALGILALGFALLYRAPATSPSAPPESNERRRR
jgi:hypothetical protein